MNEAMLMFINTRDIPVRIQGVQIQQLTFNAELIKLVNCNRLASFLRIFAEVLTFSLVITGEISSDMEENYH